MPDRLTPEELAAIRDREQKATPGPWRWEPGVIKHYVVSANGELHMGVQEWHPLDGHTVPAAENCAFVAHARQDIPRLLAHIEAVEAALKRRNAWAGTVCGFLDWMTTETFSCDDEGRIVFEPAKWNRMQVRMDEIRQEAFREPTD